MDNQNEGKPRKRGLTSVTLGWLAERFRKMQEVKAALDEGTYRVESDQVAKAILSPAADRPEE